MSGTLSMLQEFKKGVCWDGWKNLEVPGRRLELGVKRWVTFKEVFMKEQYPLKSHPYRSFEENAKTNLSRIWFLIHKS